MNKQARGFTIIELIVVIALLGILSAVALPRFINVTSSAHDAAVEGAGAGFATGVALLKAQVVANGELGNGVQNVSGYGDGTLDVNGKGFPFDSNAGSAPASNALPSDGVDCALVWTGLMDANAPVASTTAPSADPDVDFQAGFNSPSCEFTYKEQKNGTDRLISYNASTGEVSVSIPN